MPIPVCAPRPEADEIAWFVTRDVVVSEAGVYGRKALDADSSIEVDWVSAGTKVGTNAC